MLLQTCMTLFIYLLSANVGPQFCPSSFDPIDFHCMVKTFFKILFQKTKVMQDLNNMRVTKLSGLVVNISYEWILVQPLCLISTFSPSSKQPTSVPAGWFLPHCLGGAMRGRNLPQKRRSHLLVPAQGFMLHKTHWGRADQSERRIRGVWRGWCCCFFHPPLPAHSTQKDYGG